VQNQTTHVVIESKSPQDTFRVGKTMGGLLRPGDVVAMVGELGTGKTCLVQGLAVGMGLSTSVYVSSPSFTLVHEYPGTVPFYHIDLYRLETNPMDEDVSLLEEYLDRKGITVVEWADRMTSLLPQERLWVDLQYAGEGKRSIHITAVGRRFGSLLSALVDQVQHLKPS